MISPMPAYKAVQKNQLICNPHPVGRRTYFIKRYLPFLYRKGVIKMAEGLKNVKTSATRLKRKGCLI